MLKPDLLLFCSSKTCGSLHGLTSIFLPNILSACVQFPTCTSIKATVYIKHRGEVKYQELLIDDMD